MKKNRKIGRRVFITTSGAALAIAITGAWRLDRYITGFSEGSIASSVPYMVSKGNPLFRYFPSLKEHLPWIPLGNFPTPIEEFGSVLGLEPDQLYVKRDDTSSNLYGGNKVRKLEYLFAEASLQGCDTIVTVGGSGSNHALTTAILGGSLGLDVELCLFHQPLSSHVIENLKGFLATSAKLHYNENMLGAYNKARVRCQELKKQGRLPYFIMSGATCGLSNFGYCGAILELKEQLEKENITFPDALFVPVGTCGTISGLVAGIKIAGLKTKVYGVKIFDSFPANSFMIKYYAQNVIERFKQFTQVDPGQINDEQFVLLKEYLGRGYGLPTEKSRASVKLAEPVLHLENTYTGKTLAACIDYCMGAGKGQKVLFWNTYNSQIFKKSESLQGLPDQLKPIFRVIIQ